MVALDEELIGIAEEPQSRCGCGAAEGAMTFPPKNQSNPRSVPYCSDTYFPDSDFSRHYARKRNYSPSIGRSISQDPLQYINGANTYQFVMSNPVGNVDPSGLDAEEELGDDGVDMGAAGGGESPAVADEMARVAAENAANSAVAAAENAIAQAAQQGADSRQLAQANSDLAWAKNGQNLADDPQAPYTTRRLASVRRRIFRRRPRGTCPSRRRKPKVRQEGRIQTKEKRRNQPAQIRWKNRCSADRHPRVWTASTKARVPSSKRTSISVTDRRSTKTVRGNMEADH
jgi:RHS repeat-associated protein